MTHAEKHNTESLQWATDNVGPHQNRNRCEIPNINMNLHAGKKEPSMVGNIRRHDNLHPGWKILPHHQPSHLATKYQQNGLHTVNNSLVLAHHLVLVMSHNPDDLSVKSQDFLPQTPTIFRVTATTLTEI